MKDWELLRDELVAADEKIDHYGPFAEIMEEPYSSPLRKESEEELSNAIEIHMLHYINLCILTNDIVDRYRDFFDRTGLETDLDKVVAEAEAKRKWKESYVEMVPPPYPPDQRKELCRKYRRSIGLQLRSMREKRGYTIREVMEATGIDKNIISRTEAGRSNTTIDTLAVLSDFYGIDLEISKYFDPFRIEKA